MPRAARQPTYLGNSVNSVHERHHDLESVEVGYSDIFLDYSIYMTTSIWILATYDVVRYVRCRTSCTYDIVRATYDIVLNIVRTMSYVRYTGYRRTTSYVRHHT